MSRLPIRVRLTLVFAVVMAVMLALLGAFLYVRLQASLDERINDELESRSAALATAVRTDRAVELEPSLFRSDEGVAQVVGPDGSGLLPPGDPVLTADEVLRARRTSLILERDGLRLRADPAGENVVVIGESLEDRDEALGALLAQLLIGLPLALLVASGIGYVVAGAALRPVEEMRGQAAEITATTSGRRLELSEADDEIRRLGGTLNEMLDRLDAGLERERRFVADASHELRTPLASLRTELELATRQPRTQRELEAALLSASEEVDHLVRLAEDLLVLARAEDGHLELRREPVPARGLLEDVARRQRARVARTDRVISVSAPDELVVEGDRQRLEQALGNLVDNALRHGDGTVRVAARLANGDVVLAVSDGGAGFPPDFLPHAFERFTRADGARTGGGAGLGLALVDAVARAHGGSAHAVNVDGGGVEVWLLLPSRLNGGGAARADSRDVG
jgi:signal transduction histidine kinase